MYLNRPSLFAGKRADRIIPAVIWITAFYL